jgi:hypothetical protein
MALVLTDYAFRRRMQSRLSQMMRAPVPFGCAEVYYTPGETSLTHVTQWRRDVHGVEQLTRHCLTESTRLKSMNPRSTLMDISSTPIWSPISTPSNLLVGRAFLPARHNGVGHRSYAL